MLYKSVILISFLFTDLNLCQETTTVNDEITDTTTLDVTTTEGSTTAITKSTTKIEQEDTTTLPPKHPILQICELTQTVKNISMSYILNYVPGCYYFNQILFLAILHRK